MRINNRLGRSSSGQTIEQFREARLVRITHGGFAIWLDPFGMLDPEVVVNLLPELRVGLDLMRRGRRLGERFMGGAGRFVQVTLSASVFRSETNEFHKPPFIWGLTAPNPRGMRNHSDEALSTATSLQVPQAPGESGDRASGVSAKVKPINRLFIPAESALRRRVT